MQSTQMPAELAEDPVAPAPGRAGPAMIPGRIVVIGTGNEFRRDDGAGLAVLERLRGRAPAGVELLVSDGDPADLIEAWTGAALAVVVDAARAQPPVPGRLHRLVIDTRMAGLPWPASSHGLGLRDAVGLGIILGRMPGTLVVHVVEAADMRLGTGLTPAVARSLEAATRAVLRDIRGPSPAGRRDQRADQDQADPE